MRTIRNFMTAYNIGKERISYKPEDMSKNEVEKIRAKMGAMYEGLTDESIKFKTYRIHKDLIQMTELALQTATFFVIDDATKYLLIDTEVPKDINILKLARLPYKSVYLDVEFSRDDFDLAEGDRRIIGILMTESFESVTIVDKEKKDIKSEYNHFLYLIVGFESIVDDALIKSIEKIKIPIILCNDSVMYYVDEHVVEFLRKFVINTLLLINQPEVEFVDASARKGNLKAKDKKRAIDIPAHKFIKLTGRLKVYASRPRESGEGEGYGYRFKVRGFWRHYKSERYKNVKGMVKWIEGFEKGEGILVKKEYLISKKEEGVLNFDDIKASTKPLRQIER
jgi:hypothetical protein